jgi:hypothetical protein
MAIEHDYTPVPTAFLIIPLDNSQLNNGTPLSIVALRATALPYHGVEFPTEQRIKTTYYPGNPQASQTVVGPTLPNTTIGGRWMDLSLTDGGARILVQQIEFMAQHAVPVEVQWGGRSFGADTSQPDDPAIVRRGLIKKFNPKYTRLENIEWTIEFEWSGADVQSQSPTISYDTLDQGADFQDLFDELSEAQDTTTSWIGQAYYLLGLGANSLLAVSDALDYAQNKIVDAMVVVESAQDLGQAVANLPNEISNRVRGVCDQVKLACCCSRAATGSFCGTYEDIAHAPTPWNNNGDSTPGSINNPISVESMRAKAAMYLTDDALTFLDRETAYYDVRKSWDALAEMADQRAASLEAQTLPDVIAVVRPPAGSDLRDQAVKYYGDSTLWPCIAVFPPNNLPTSEVPATPTGPSDTGAPPIYIPRLTSASTALAALWGAET